MLATGDTISSIGPISHAHLGVNFNPMTKALVLGNATFNTMIQLDKFPEPRPQTVFSSGSYSTVGGTAAGKALNLNRLGLETTLHCLLGDDDKGRQIQRHFERESLHYIYEDDPAGTERHINLMNDDGSRISIYVVYSSLEPEVDWEHLEPLVAACDYLVVNIINYARPALALARRYQKAVWCDIHDYDGRTDYHRQFIAAADYLFMSSDQMPGYRNFMTQMMDIGKKLVVCTHGKKGSTALTGEGQWIEVPVVKEMPRQDTNGAGDAFFAGFIYGDAQGYSVEKCLQMGTVVGGLCVTSPELYHPELSADMVEELHTAHFGKSGV